MVTIIILVLGVLFLISILSLIAPKTYDVSKSIEISSTKEEVWEYLRLLENHRKWSPWIKKDPNMFTEIRGVDGEVGAVSYWRGNKEVGEGEQEIIRVIEGKRIDQQLRFLKPWKSISDSYVVLAEISKNKCSVVWGFRGDTSFPMNIMILFKSMDAMVGKDFEEGLQTLKSIIEK